jgi:hypothetical protein
MAILESDRRYLEAWQAKLSHPLSVRFLRNHRPESDLLANFVEALKELVPRVSVGSEVVPETELPGLALGEAWRFHAVPEGKVLEMLGEIALAVDGQASGLAPAVQSRWKKLPLGPDLTIFIAPQCHFCPQMVRQLVPLTVIPPKAGITLIDASLFTELARKNEIKAVPTVIVNGVYRLTGAFQLAELLDLVEKTDPAQLPMSVWERMMQEGQAGVLGDMMLEKGVIFPNVLPLLLHPEINIRLGAMVALETVGEARPELVAAILPRLWQEYAGSDMPVQGDIIYLIGEWGDGTWTGPLEAAEGETSEPELREALEEALEKLREKQD